MPKVQKILLIDITPERFVRECSDSELNELVIETEKELHRRIRRAEGFMNIEEAEFYPTDKSNNVRTDCKRIIGTTK